MHKLIVGLISAVLLLGLTACGDQAPPDEGTMSGSTDSDDFGSGSGYVSDPQDGWVLVNNGTSLNTYVAKRCDGSTLVYISDGIKSGGIAAIPDSSECTS